MFRFRTSIGVYGVLLWMLAAPSFAQTAETGEFVADRNGLPTSARTRFFDPWANVDLQNTAEHELLHGLGFARAYTNFRDRIRPQADDKRDFTHNGAAGGTLRMTLGPASAQTHLDAALTVNGTDQANEIMRPDQVRNQRMSAYVATPLNDAFGWNGRNLDVRITFRAGFTAGEQALISAAETAAEALFTGNQSGDRFEWTVVAVGERPKKAEKQLPPADGEYDTLVGDEMQFIDGGTTVVLRDIRISTPASGSISRTMLPSGDQSATFATTLRASGEITSSSLGLNHAAVSVNLSGTAQTIVYADAGYIESQYRTELVALQVSGSATTPSGAVPIAIRESSSLESGGEASFFDESANLWRVDSYFDVNAELSLGGGNYIPATQSVYTDFQTIETRSLLGDANCDGHVDNFDIDPFVMAVLMSESPIVPAGYSAGQACWEIRNVWGDIDHGAGGGVGHLNNFDIDPFVSCILNAPPPGQGCP